MRIQKIHIENFGRLHDLNLDFNAGLNVIRAENGWGKSTLAAFIKAMFYGLDYTTKRSLKENERKKYLPWQGGAFGGSMEFLAGKKRYRVERTFGVREKEDTFVLYDLSTGLRSDVYSEKLGEELFHVDRSAFARSSFFTQQDFTVSVNDSLNTGLTHVGEDARDMQNYENAVSSLEERMKYYRKTGGRGQIDKWKEEQWKIHEALNDCREKEKAAAKWKEKIAEKECEEQALSQNIRKLENEIRDAQVYREGASKRAQHDFLKNQAHEREEKLRQTAAALAEFTRAPATEEELDRCRDSIYQLRTLRMQEGEAAEQRKQAEDYLKELENSMEKLPGPNIAIWFLMSFLVAAGMMAIVRKWVFPGIFLVAAGLAIACTEIYRERLAEKRKKSFWDKHASGEQALKAAEENSHSLKNRREALEREISGFLHLPEGTGIQDIERLWKLERQRSQTYGILKQTYESQRKEACRSREAWLQFRGNLSEEEISRFLNLEESKREIAELQQELEKFRSIRESLVKELRDMHNQVRILEENAEQIPELEEEEERILGELENAVGEYGLLEKTVKYLKTARDQFSTRYLKELQQGLLHYMEILEPKQDAQVALDVRLKVKIQEAGAFRDLEYFSAGWQDLIQIAERFSVVDALYKEEQPVLILDDSFVNLDTEKQKRAMGLLEKMAEKRQMIYFTCRV